MTPESHRLAAPSHLNTSRDVGVIWQINQALAHDPRTAGHQVQINAVEGRIRLIGNVLSEVVRSAAIEVARGVPGVRSVIDELRVVHVHR